MEQNKCIAGHNDVLSGDFWPSCEAKESNIPIGRSTKIKNMQALNSLHAEYASSTFQE